MFGEEEEERKEGRESTSPSPSASSSEHSDLSDDDVPGAMEPEPVADQHSAPVKKSVRSVYVQEVVDIIFSSPIR